jgi:hypothetical protein
MKLANFTLQVELEDADTDDLDRHTRQLRDEILDFDVETAELVKGGKSPKGTKAGAEVITFGAIALAVLPAVLPKLVEFLQNWTLRDNNRIVKLKTQVGNRSVEVEFSPTKTSTKEIEKLVNMLTGKLSTNPG